MPTPPKLLTRIELAAVLHMKPRTLAHWLEEGMPVAERGKAGRPSRYDETDVRAWMAARNAAAVQASQGGCATFADARMRKELAQAAEAEQRVAMRAGRLLAVEEVDRVWSAQVAAVRSTLLALPTALADRLHRAAVTAGPAAVETALQAAIYDALRELASGELPPPATPATQPAPRAPKASARRRPRGQSRRTKGRA
jgi:phage terminase Nu1 subunit (DNA packaging protein)